MPDPADPSPVEAVRRGGSWTVVDKDGRELPEAGGGMDEAKARGLARTVNGAWRSAKRDRKSAGASAVTEARVERRAERFRRILGV